jgi:predicted DCC family thiol-disulfide oxidoreductase YuxK
LCRWAARVVATLDRQEDLALLPLAEMYAARLLASVPEERRKECWWLVLRDGTAVAGDAGGGVKLLTELQSTRLIGRALGALRLSPLIDAFDKLVAHYRSGLSRLVPDGPAPRRYP